MRKASLGLLLAALSLSAPARGQTDPANELRLAAVGLYEAINAGDADRVIRHMVPGGYTEFAETGGPVVTLDTAYIRTVLGSDVEIDLRVADMAVRVVGDAGVVTGFRVGSITPPNGSKSEGRYRLSMFWVRHAAIWKLAHVHLSAPRAQ